MTAERCAVAARPTLRGALKILGRRFGLQAIEVREERRGGRS
jgi:hypothetical protein